MSALLRVHVGSLRAYARLALPDWNAVDEVLSDTSIVIWKKLDQLESNADFLKWARAILRLEVLKYQERRYGGRIQFDSDVVEKLWDKSDEMQRGDGSAYEAVQACLEQFSDQQRELLLATPRGHGGLKELAERVGVKAELLYARCRRLRRKLQQCVEKRME